MKMDPKRKRSLRQLRQLVQRMKRAKQARRIPRCEVCKKKPAVSFSLFAEGVWLYTCYCTDIFERYFVRIDRWYLTSEQHREDVHRHQNDRQHAVEFERCWARWMDAGGKWLLRNYDKPKPIEYANGKEEEATT